MILNSVYVGLKPHATYTKPDESGWHWYSPHPFIFIKLIL